MASGPRQNGIGILAIHAASNNGINPTAPSKPLINQGARGGLCQALGFLPPMMYKRQ